MRARAPSLTVYLWGRGVPCSGRCLLLCGRTMIGADIPPRFSCGATELTFSARNGSRKLRGFFDFTALSSRPKHVLQSLAYSERLVLFSPPRQASSLRGICFWAKVVHQQLSYSRLWLSSTGEPVASRISHLDVLCRMATLHQAPRTI